MSDLSKALSDASSDPATTVAAIESAATRHETPCGAGTMIWRCWGERRAGRAPLLLLHGGSGSWTHWIRNIAALAEVTEVWTADIPGLGDSAMPHEPLTPEHAATIVSEGAMHLLADRFPIHLAAFSFGSHVGTFAARNLGSRVASFTISGCAALGIPHNFVPLERLSSTMTKTQIDAANRTNLERLMFADPRRIDTLAVYVQGENVRRARLKSRPFASTAEIVETLPLVSAPLRAIWGGRDVVATPTVEARYDLLRRQHPELLTRTIADAGHWVAYEQPSAYTEALLSMTGLTG